MGHSIGVVMFALGERVVLREPARTRLATVRARTIQENPRYDVLTDEGCMVLNVTEEILFEYNIGNSKLYMQTT